MYKIYLTDPDDEIRSELGEYATLGQATEAMLGYAASKIREVMEAHKSDVCLNDAIEAIEEETYLRAAKTYENGEIDYAGETELLVYQDYADYGTLAFGKSDPYFVYYLYSKDKLEVLRYYPSTGKFEKNQ